MVKRFGVQPLGLGMQFWVRSLALILFSIPEGVILGYNSFMGSEDHSGEG